MHSGHPSRRVKHVRARIAQVTTQDLFVKMLLRQALLQLAFRFENDSPLGATNFVNEEHVIVVTHNFQRRSLLNRTQRKCSNGFFSAF